MTSYTTMRFRKAFGALPQRIRRQATQAYKKFKQNPHHPSLRFKQIHPAKPVYSVRVSRGYRALGVREGALMIWFWIGSHADYDSLASQM